MEGSYKRGDLVRAEISGSAFEGKAVARLEGLVIFVDGGVPGDLLTVRITKVKKNHLEARVETIETPSPLRTTPRCRHFGACGGCKWQHVDYRAQLDFKERHVRDAFERIGGFEDPPILPIIGSDEIYFYRNKMEFSFSDQQWLTSPPERDALPDRGVGSSTYLGLHVPQRFDKILDISECYLQSELSNRILSAVRDFARKSKYPVYSYHTHSGYFRFLVIRQAKRTNELMVNLVTSEDQTDEMLRFTKELRSRVPEITTVVNTINSKKAQVAFGEHEETYFGPGVIHEQIGGLTFTISAGSFFQTNTAQAERLYEITKSFAALKGTELVYDLYSGTGSIALFVANSARHVVGIESVESAISDAERNARQNGVKNCTFIQGDLKDRLTKDVEWMKTHPRPDVLIIDPPRSGMHPTVVEEIVRLNVPLIVYVSCNPATQARDVKEFCENNYGLEKIQPVDMFPHTYHIESVAQLCRRKG
ncbi:MAG: 23S rRNA (uracil(1939)-C(5))-methyltransferase RlmD [Ignavibacteria bacterium]|nr:23S rRNA (uracil(1939)-C(5))-methyltransferase RlmD [Ignavibacteria bacterium]